MKRALLGVVCLALLVVPATSVSAHPHLGDRVFPPLSRPYGMTYPEWFSGYQVWWNSIPTPVNPAIDPEAPRNCASRGPVVFGGPFGSGDGCRARAGQAFAFGGPGWECSTAEGLGDTFHELRTCAIENYDIDFAPPAFRTTLRIDGELVRQPRRWTFVTPGEIIDFPEDNIWGAVPGPSKSVSKGVFYIVRPMAVGRHRIVMRVFIEGEYAFAVVWKVKVVGYHSA